MTAVEMRGRHLEPIFAGEIDRQVHRLESAGGPRPRLATLLVGDDPAARSYRASIARTFGRLNVLHEEVDLSARASEDEIIATIAQLNDRPELTGVMVFLPLPGRHAEWSVREALSPLKDVDGITPTSAGRLRLGRSCLEPACPRAGVTLLKAYGVNLDGAHAAVIGRSAVVGGPLAAMLVAENATVTVCHTHTRDLAAITRSADIVACAAGHAHLVTADMVRTGATILDFGTNVVEGRLVGDSDAAHLKEKVRQLSPVPGGTGPATSLVLAYQTMLGAFAVHAGSPDGILSAPSIGELVEAGGRTLASPVA